MRLLHTSDWHLGASIEQVDCQPEHDKFLDWLIDTLDQRAIDVLVVAGDVFHYQNPGNTDRKRYFNFLVRCARIDSLHKVVIVAGNHDSPTGLEAPKELLGALDVHVIGNIPKKDEDWPECLVPVENDDGEVEMVVAAVPYVQEARLGVSLADGGEQGLRERFRERFRELYAALAEEATDQWPDADLVTTGHMTVYGEEDEKQEGDFHTAIHRTRRPRAEDAREDEDTDDSLAATREIGMIEALDPGIFDARYDYVALGHIHRPMPVGGRRHVRYSGTPVATTLDEDTPPRRVNLVDFDETNDEGISPRIDALEVPKWREILEIQGTMEGLKEQLTGMDPEKGRTFPPAVYLNIEIAADDLMSDRITPLQEALEESHEDDWRPIIVDLEETAADGTDLDDLEGERSDRDIGTDNPREVFIAMYEREHPGVDGPPDEIMEAFTEIAGELIDTDEGDDKSNEPSDKQGEP